MILSFKHDPNHSDRFLRSVLKIWNVNTRRQECDRAGMSAAVENSDYNVHKQAERLLSDDTSLQFKPRHDGGKARQGEALQVGPCCITVVSVLTKTCRFSPGTRNDEVGKVETTPSTLSKHSENCQGDGQGFDLSGGRNTC